MRSASRVAPRPRSGLSVTGTTVEMAIPRAGWDPSPGTREGSTARRVLPGNKPLGEHTMLKGARTVCAIGALALTLAIAACGDDDSSGGGGGSAEPAATTQTGTPVPADTSALQLKAQEQGGLSFDKKELTAKAGELTIKMENPSS